MESFNAELIKHKVDKSKRFTHLRQMAKEQLAHLNTIDTEKKFRILTDNDKQLEYSLQDHLLKYHSIILIKQCTS